MSIEASILERLNALEKQNRRMKQTGVLVILIAASLFLMGQTAAKRTVEANEFVLRDSNGTVRSKWFMAKDGPVLSLLDENGTERIALKVPSNRAPEISLSGPKDTKSGIELSGPTGPFVPGGIMLTDTGGYALYEADSLMFKGKGPGAT